MFLEDLRRELRRGYAEVYIILFVHIHYILS